MPDEIIYHKTMGDKGPWLIILHGLFGSSDNWSTLAGQWAENYRVVLCDARNHGKSFHSDNFNYDLMAEDVAKLMEHLDIEDAFILGHSMGGKTVMRFSQLYPEKLKAMMVADIGPKSYPPHHDEIIKAFESVNLEETKSRSEATKQVQSVISDPGVAMFLLKNLYWKEKGQLAWRINLPVLKREISKVIEDLPKDEVATKALFVRGGKSNYILNDDWPDIKAQFVNSHLVTIKNAGHWLHAEQPEAFYQTITAYLDKVK
ncbi:alpha/beta fold hydrolase [Luteibaculum oceani]|uniref:Alpha/beta fold hydrolase n=1 Tax=Luteibaculum oceani TaxID=1294296 RepID=A0A5C6V268_9FLAO|nr:alpha/beta fold hydrolase [Luteibaculum oceani]TXC78910.1 alpha/beta fold hydrolase [Luteibaculum oceani]